MKPPVFSYHEPANLDEALALLAQFDDTKLLAGGQSLLPMLNMRFVMPEHVIDLNRVPDLGEIRFDAGKITIGAMTRQRALQSCGLLQNRCPLMIEALHQVGHRATRNRGTLGGSLCHLDPAAELPVVMAALDAHVHVQGPRGARTIPMTEFPAFYMTPSIEPDEIVTAVEFEPWAERHGYSFVEFARRHGDFAIVAAAVLVELNAGAVRRCTVTLGGVGAGPLRLTAAEQTFTDSDGSTGVAERAAQACRTIDAMEDVQASTAYRRHLAEVLTCRALNLAVKRASDK
ncbi:MAG: FAD binding domain-containing protein [Gammaproteobacteria bacterium]